MDGIGRKLGRVIFGKMLPRRPYRVLIGPLRGARFVLGSMAGEGGGATVYFNKVESEQTAAIQRELSPGKTFFDLGANVGYYSILASRLVGRGGHVAAFEPVVRNLSFLQRHIELNDAENVQVLPFAVSSEAGILSFSTGSNSGMGSLDFDGGNGKMLVPTVTLDEIAERLKLTPDVLKIDVEGAEVEVFRGATRILNTARPTIFLSTHSTDLREQCLAHLRDTGYTVESLLDSDDPHEFLAKYLE
ncbi:MAG: FkbM family methyltransferase [Pyrinomonadaceae bacterium]